MENGLGVGSNFNLLWQTTSGQQYEQEARMEKMAANLTNVGLYNDLYNTQFHELQPHGSETRKDNDTFQNKNAAKILRERDYYVTGIHNMQLARK